MIKLTNIFNIIIEGAYDAQGVGDKAYERFHIPTDKANLKAMAELQRQENGKPVARVGKDGTYIFLNPRSLRYFDRNVRAVADNHGNIYVAQKDGDFIHFNIAKAVGIAPSDSYDRRNKFVSLIRTRNNNYFIDTSTDSDIDDDDHTATIRALRMKHTNFEIVSQY